MGVDPSGKALTSKSFAASGEAFGQDEMTAKKNIHDLLMKEEK